MPLFSQLTSWIKSVFSLAWGKEHLPLKATMLRIGADFLLLILLSCSSQIFQVDPSNLLYWEIIVIGIFLAFVCLYLMNALITSENNLTATSTKIQEHLGDSKKEIEGSLNKFSKDMGEYIKTSLNEITYSSEKHIDVVCMSKEIVIDSNMFSSGPLAGMCQLYHYFKIHNPHPEHPYAEYIYRLESKEDLSDISNYQIWVDNQKSFEPSELIFQKYEQYNFDPNNTTCKTCNANCLDECKKYPTKRSRERVGNEITIPIDISKDKNTRELHILEKKCPSFPDLSKFYYKSKRSKVESIGIMVYYPTRLLRLSVSITNLENYQLACGGLENGKKIKFDVVDRNEQHIWHHEAELKSWKAYPLLSLDKKTLTWEIHNPKIGYRYRMYFSLVYNLENPRSHSPDTAPSPSQELNDAQAK